TPELIALLSHANAWQRTTAHRLLLERQDRSAVEPLRKTVATAEEPLARVHAAWLLQSMGALDEPSLLALLRHAQPRVREHGVRVAETHLAEPPTVRKEILALAADADAELRFQVALTLGEWDDDRTLEPLVAIGLRGADDPWTRLAVASSVPKRAGALLAVL